MEDDLLRGLIVVGSCALGGWAIWQIIKIAVISYAGRDDGSANQ